MDLSAIKRAPRWAWVTAAGIGIGAAGVKLYKNRAKPASEQATTTSDGSALDAVGNPLPTSSGNPVATIVPPVIIGGQTADPNAGVGELQALYISGVQTLVDSFQSVWGPVMTSQMELLSGYGQTGMDNASTIQALALAGSAPKSNTQLPAEIVPQPAPAPPAPVAIVPASAPAPAPASPCGNCASPYPLCNETNGACYTVACASGTGTRRKGKWHLYANLPDVWMGPTC
jgi:hypothetical protein